jgi:hypothetical protein
MNWKEASKLKVGAIVRRSWETGNGTLSDTPPQQGLVIAKDLEEGVKRREMSLSQNRSKRYWLTVSWFRGPSKYSRPPASTSRLSSWELMVVSHTQ